MAEPVEDEGVELGGALPHGAVGGALDGRELGMGGLPGDVLAPRPRQESVALRLRVMTVPQKGGMAASTRTRRSTLSG